MAESAKPEEVDARKLIAARINRDPVNYRKSNLFQQRLYRAVRDPRPESLTVVLALKPNRVGGSWGVMTLWSAMMYGSKNPAFSGSPFGEQWPFVRSARIVSTAECLGDVGPIQRAMTMLFPLGQYSQSRGVGKNYNSAGRTSTGWDWDAYSYGQDALTAAGFTKGLVLMSEPPPHALYTECLTRLSGNGMMIVECTQLDLAGWLEDLAEEASGKTVDGITYGSLNLHGKSVGEVRIVRGDIEDSCREHSNGHQSHSAIEATIAGWPEEEREARKTGKPMRLSGRIYPNWTDANELEALPAWHQDQIEQGKVIVSSVIDPADRKPWAMGWFATFENEDVIGLCEWPSFTFHTCRASPVSDIERYRDVILETEAALGVSTQGRLIDGLFGAAIKSGRGLNIIQMLRAPCLGCLAKAGLQEQPHKIWAEDPEAPEPLPAVICPHRLTYRRAPAYDGSVRDGHILVRAHVGEGGARPKAYALKEYMPNFCYGMRRYAWKENTREHLGLSEKPQLVNKDFPDLIRMLLQSRGHLWPKEPAPTKIIPRRRR